MRREFTECLRAINMEVVSVIQKMGETTDSKEHYKLFNKLKFLKDMTKKVRKLLSTIESNTNNN